MITAFQAKELTLKAVDLQLQNIYTDIETMAKSGKNYLYTPPIKNIDVLKEISEKLLSLGYMTELTSENEIRISW